MNKKAGMAEEEGDEIAEKVGYSDAHYFGSIFKRNEGMTPKEYAKRNKI